MENKKPLILVPPMSEPMAKLKEVLDGIAAEENIEIFIVNDSKEFGQLVGSGGQALIMMSNAKICATLLQENKAAISKNHSKVILLTPKEIPIKTLEKFRKVGLTEAILENTAPKTLLYKVKLQLKSIKLQVKEENTQQVVKSMLDMNAKLKEAEEEVVTSEKALVGTIEETGTDESNVRKKVIAEDSDEKLDYLSNLRGKKAQTEEAIETHWKSKREKAAETETDEEGNLKTKSASTDENDIDMFYRGKMKKNTTELEVEQEDIYKKTKVEEEVEAEDIYKREKIEQEEITESAERKRPKMVEEEVADYKMKKEQQEESVEKDKKKNKNEVEEENFDFEDFRQKLLDQIDGKQEKDNDPNKAEDLGGHYKGKLKQNFEEEEEPEITQESQIEEALVSEKKKKEKLFEETEEDITTDKKRQEIEEDENDPHDGKVDEIDNFMRGDLERTEAIKTRMESRSDSKENSLEDDSNDESQTKSNNKFETVEEDEDRPLSLQEEEELAEGFKREKLSVEDKDSDYKREKLSKEEKDRFNENKSTDKELEDDQLPERSRSAKVEEADDDYQRESSKKEEDSKKSRERDAGLQIEDKEKQNRVHEGRTDKINTYYRSGESKDKEQNWDIHEKKNSTDIQLEKSKKVEESLENLKKGSAGETTIDYRKLKEEFDLISKGEYQGEGAIGPDGKPGLGKDYSSEESFQVVELGPTSFDFSIEILNLIYQQDNKPIVILKAIAEKLLKEENAVLMTFSYKLSDKKYTETFNSYNEFNATIDPSYKEMWDNIKNDQANLELFNSLSMPTWICRKIPDKDTFWRDFDLPSWANQELTNKDVELLYPFFDGVDRMGYAHILFPTGIKPANEKKIIIIVEMLRSVFLDTIQRKKVESNKDEPASEEKTESKNVLSMFSGLFGKKKAS